MTDKGRLWITLLLNYLALSQSFNVDSEANRLEFSISGGSGEDKSSFFGYSIGLFKTLADARLIIGAPNHSNRAGAVYSCRVNGNDNSCSKMDAVASSNTEIPGNDATEGESLGVTISTTENTVTACASMTRFKPTNQACVDDPESKSCLFRRNYFMGRCPVFDEDLKFKYSDIPCYKGSLNRTPHLNRYGMCMLGTGGVQSFNNEGKLYQFISAPGSGRYIGAVVSTVDGDKNSNFVNKVNLKDDTTFLRSAEVKNDDSKSFTAQHAMVGYSTAKGNFTGEVLPGLASGSPRAALFGGQVMIYQYRLKNGTATPDDLDDDSELTIKQIITNPAPSKGGPSLFGASVAAIDINGDGFDDLAVGAPLFANSVGNRIGQDEGRVFIFINNKNGQFSFKQNMTLEGENVESSRFGSTVVNIGDINGDGSDDLAVGAPWGGKDGNGAVYIYNVRDGQLTKTHSQVLSSPSGAGFGYSISSAKIDTRVYPALAVGAPESGRVFLFKAKTIITLEDNLWIDRITIPTDESNCEFGKVKYQCITFRANLKDASTNAPAKFDLEITFEADVRDSAAAGRALIYDNSTKTLVKSVTNKVTFIRGRSLPYQHTIYISIDKATNFESPVRLTTSYRTFASKNNCEDGPCAILDQFGALSGFAVVKYLKQCGTDQVCDVDLDIEDTEIRVKKGASSVIEPLYIGSFNDEIKLIAKVRNRNESAYQAKMEINFHEDFALLQISVNGRDSIIPEYNGENKNGTGNVVKFLLDNPILEREVVDVEAQFIIKSLARPKFFEYPFNLTVNSTGNDINQSNNRKTIKLPMKIQSCVQISLDRAEGGDARNEAPKLLYDNLKKPIARPQSAQEAGPKVEYTILVQNSGRVPIDNMSIDVTLVDRVGRTNIIYITELSVEGQTCELNKINTGKLFGSQPTQTNDVAARRKRRDVIQRTDTRPPILNCLNGHCQTMTCKNVLNVPVDGIRRLKLSMAVYLEALQKFQSDEMVITVTPKFGGTFGSIVEQAQECPAKIELRQPFGKITAENSDIKRVEWWIVLVAVVGALIFLAIFCAVLYRIGFFKRHRLEEESPLHQHHIETYQRKPQADGYGSGSDD
uniref:Uncharacterized protein n=2 Tax=Clytia hemisphaerica TaxID=252671 RepID=A0A7M5XGG6_9CNID